MNKSFCLKTDSDMNIRDHNDKIIVPKELNLKNIQKIIRIPITPKCQLKCDTFSEKQLLRKFYGHRHDLINYWISVKKYVLQMTTDMFHLSKALPCPFLIHDLSSDL